MDIFRTLRGIFSLFNSLTTFSVSGILQIAYSVNSPMFNYFCCVSHIKLGFSLSVKKMTRRGVEPRSVDLKAVVISTMPRYTYFKHRAKYIIIGKTGRGQLCL